jgi:hypothetical protein
MYRYLFLLVFFIPVYSSAQISIHGKVIGSDNKIGIANASVFLSNSKVGTITKKDGTYELTYVKDGQYDMVVSCIGYETYRKQISVKYSNIQMPDIELVPRINQLGEVKIRPSRAKRDLKRERYIRMFKEQFLGRTPNAAHCRLLNPELLDFNFEESGDKLSATSSDFLVIENKALGYRIKYLLKSFLYDPRDGIAAYTGSSVFEPLYGTPQQENNWINKRTETYKGSELQFLRACIADAMPLNGFTVRKLYRTPTPGRPSDSLIYEKVKYIRSHPIPFGSRDSLNYWIGQSKLSPNEQRGSENPLKTTEYVKRTDEKGVYALGYSKPIMINFRHKENSSNEQTSYIIFAEPYTYFDSNGVIFTPKNCVIEGYWATLRIADLLPVDYELGK